MKSIKFAIFAVALILVLIPGAALAQQLSMDDFVPPAQGGTTAVEGQVSEDQGVVKAEKAQDGLNHAYEMLMAEDEEGVRQILVPSGLAVISVAKSIYSVYDNRNATLMSKRAAYVKAMLKAQKAMIEHRDGSLSVCAKGVEESMLTIDTGAGENMANTSEVVIEKCMEMVGGMLRGSVLYSVEDRPGEKKVIVSVASSTKTRDAVKHLGGAVVESNDPQRAWAAIVSQITNGVIPPLGCRLITNPETGENIVIGFGSAIVRHNKNPKVADKLADVAKKQARMRSRNALVSFLKGDKVYWAGGFDETQLEASEQFEVVDGEDTASGEDEIKARDESRDVFINALGATDVYAAVTAGRVPPGVKTKIFLDKTKDWAIAVSVYSKSMERQATQAKDSKSRDGRPIKVEGGVNDSAPNPAGPSGTVSKDTDL